MYRATVTHTGLKEAIAKLKTVRMVLPKATVQVTKEILTHVAARAVVNAPILTGELREAIKTTSVKRTSDNNFSGFVEDDVPYAEWIHESKYNLGPISRQQPATMEGGDASYTGTPEGIGRKYIERVAYFHALKYLNAINRATYSVIDTGKIIRQTL